MQIQRRYLDFTGAPEWMRQEFLQLAGEAEQARAQVVADQRRAQETQKRTALTALVVAVLTGLLGYWRGRRAAPRVTVRGASK